MTAARLFTQTCEIAKGVDAAPADDAWLQRLVMRLEVNP